jgi:hypothetical protein
VRRGEEEEEEVNLSRFLRSDGLMTPKWRRSIVVPFDKEKAVKPTRS